MHEYSREKERVILRSGRHQDLMCTYLRIDWSEEIGGVSNLIRCTEALGRDGVLERLADIFIEVCVCISA